MNRVKHMIESTYNLKRSPRYPQVRFLIHWRRMMGTHFTVLRRTRIFFTWSRMVIGCEVEDGDLLPRQRTDSRDLQGLPLACRGCPRPSGILVSPNNLGWGSRYFRQPNDVVTREINKVNFQIIKYQKLTSYILMTLVVVSTGHAPFLHLRLN